MEWRIVQANPETCMIVMWAMEAIAIRVEAIALRVEAIALRVEA